MTAPYRKIHCCIWSDDTFPDLDDDAQLVWLHAFTCEYTTGLGIYKVSLEGLAADKGWALERYREGFMTLHNAGLVTYDARRHVVYFPQFFRWNPPENPNVLAGLLKGLAAVPSGAAKTCFIKDLQTYAQGWGDKYREVVEALAPTFGEGSPNREREREQEREQDREQEREQDKEGARRARPPTPAPQANTAPAAQPAKASDRRHNPAATAADLDEPIARIPLKGSAVHAVTAADYNRYVETYPGVDVRQQLAAMADWCQANPERRKTKKGATAFVSRWLAREQNRGPPRAAYARNQGAAEQATQELQHELAKEAINGVE